MKLKVINTFCDKIDHATIYGEDAILEVKDTERAQDLITRGLCKAYKGNIAPAFILEAEEETPKEDKGNE